MLPSVALHIGAHKTATTHLQRSLSGQRDLVEQAGARFFGPPAFRNGPSVAELFGLEGDVTADAAQSQITRMAAGAGRVVMSEENFIGTMHDRNAKIPMPLYPRAARRITKLAARIAPDGLDVFLGIRDPAAYITSGYCQALIGGHRVVLDDVKAKNPVDGIDWVNFVDRLRQAKGVRRLTVWRYEDYHRLFGQITAGVLGQPSAIKPLTSVVHPGLSAKAVAHIAAQDAKGDAKQAAIAARNQFPVGSDYAPFEAFTAAEKASSAQQYADQFAQIAAMDNVTLLKA